MNVLKTEILVVKNLGHDKITRAYWLNTGLQSMATSWWAGTYMVFLLGHGLTLWQATMLNFVFMTVNTIFNPHTGNLADKFGQKKVFLIGQVVWFTGMLIYATTSDFVGFALAEAVSAIGSALMSDTLDSWVFNLKGEKHFKNTVKRAGPIGALAAIPTATLGAIIGARFGYQWPWMLSAISGFGVCIASYIMMRELPEGHENRETATPSVAEVLRAVIEIKPLRFIAIVTLVLAACTQPFNMFWQPILQNLSGSAGWLGSMWIGIAVMSIVGSYWGAEQGNGEGTVKMLFLVGVPMLLTPFGGAIPTAGLFIVHEIGRGASSPVLKTFANKHIPANCRTTANSILSAVRTVGAAIGLLLFGFLTNILPPINLWFGSALALTILAIYVWRYTRKER